MSSCSTPWWAEYASWQIAARIPATLQAAIDAPTPEPQTRTPRSAAPARIASPMLLRLVGVVDLRLGRVGAEVDRLVARAHDLLEHALPELDAAVVEGERRSSWPDVAPQPLGYTA